MNRYKRLAFRFFFKFTAFFLGIGGLWILSPDRGMVFGVESKELSANLNSGGNDRYGFNTGGGAMKEPIVSDALDQTPDLGAGWIRVLCGWHETEPAENQWNFSLSDRFLEKTRKLGLKVVLQLTLGTFFCTTEPGDLPDKSISKPPMATDEQFSDYVFHVVSRFGSRDNQLGNGYGQNKVAYFEIGNEPDLETQWRNHPEEYARILHLAYVAVKKADPSAKVVLGGLAAGGGQSCNTNFLDQILADAQFPANQNFDIFNYHTYARKKDQADKYNEFRKKIGDKPFWVTETGFPADPETQRTRRPNFGYESGEAGQVSYMKDVLPELLRLGVEKVFWYTLVDQPRDNTPFCTYGLLYLPGKQGMGKEGRGLTGTLAKKKIFEAFRELAAH
ncbi:MAG: cellulase family glycosylhydrolase [Spirochaetia bacterium]|nr:cellulase family glycosylhydrolase [Spirochaetia bacterium]